MIAVERRGIRAGVILIVLVLAFLHFLLAPIFDSWFVSPNLLVCAVLVSARQVRPAGAAAIGFVRSPRLLKGVIKGLMKG